MLPPTLRELHSKYDILGAQSSAPGAHVAMVMPERTQVGLIVDMMLAVLSASEFDHYMIFKLFESFPEVCVWGSVTGVLVGVVCVQAKILQSRQIFFSQWSFH